MRANCPINSANTSTWFQKWMDRFGCRCLFLWKKSEERKGFYFALCFLFSSLVYFLPWMQRTSSSNWVVEYKEGSHISSVLHVGQLSQWNVANLDHFRELRKSGCGLPWTLIEFYSCYFLCRLWNQKLSEWSGRRGHWVHTLCSVSPVITDLTDSQLFSPITVSIIKDLAGLCPWEITSKPSEFTNW